MPKRKGAAADLAPGGKAARPGHKTSAAVAVAIDPNGVYSPSWVRDALRLRESSLRREIREGRLQVNKRCGRYFFTGDQLLSWLRGGAIQRTPHAG